MFRDPDISCDFVMGSRWQLFDIISFSILIGDSCPGKCSFKHPSGADKAVTAPPLNAKPSGQPSFYCNIMVPSQGTYHQEVEFRYSRVRVMGVDFRAFEVLRKWSSQVRIVKRTKILRFGSVCGTNQPGFDTESRLT